MAEAHDGMKMRRSIMARPGVIEFDEAPIPEPMGDEVLVRIERVGICGSDMHVYHGTHPYTQYPITQGHEFSGVVVSSGPEARRVRAGSRITAPPQLVCGRCEHCVQGRSHICDELKVLGFQAPGTAQDCFLFRESALVDLPATFTPELGALVEPAAVAVHALRRAGRIEGQDVLVLGAGTIGNLVGQLALAQGARTVLVTDVHESRLEVARACGIEHVSKADDASLQAKLSALFGSRRADLVLECVGVESTIAQAVETARKGGLIVVVGVFGRPCSVNFGLVQDRELQIIGSLMYEREDFIRARELLRNEEVRAMPLLSRNFPLTDFANAYEYLEEQPGTAMKVMIDLTA